VVLTNKPQFPVKEICSLTTTLLLVWEEDGPRDERVEEGPRVAEVEEAMG
jgi:hypothetical protein